MFWSQFMGISSPETTLFLGLIQIGCWPAYIIASVITLKRGDAVSGNCFMIFACCFGGIGGLTNLFAYLGGIWGWPLDNSIIGYVWIWSGIVVTAVVIAIREAPLVSFLTFLVAIPLLEIMGFVTLGYLTAPVWVAIAGWLCLAMAIGGIYSVVASFLGWSGINIPLGKPLFGHHPQNGGEAVAESI